MYPHTCWPMADSKSWHGYLFRWLLSTKDRSLNKFTSLSFSLQTVSSVSKGNVEQYECSLLSSNWNKLIEPVKTNYYISFLNFFVGYINATHYFTPFLKMQLVFLSFPYLPHYQCFSYFFSLLCFLSNIIKW